MADRSLTQFGFVWGPMEVQRTAELPDDRLVVTVKTPRRTLELYVSPTGLIRVFDRKRGELKPHV